MTDLDRSTRSMAVLTVISRLSGFARVVVFTHVFAKTFLANTYQTANLIPNILFELFAAGALQAVLVPTMVRLIPAVGPSKSGGAGSEDLREAENVAGTVLGLLCAAMAFLGGLALLFGPAILGVLFDKVESSSIRDAEVELGALWLWFFMPQLVFYAANVVATAVLNARGRFALPAFAPTLNNVVVIAAYLWFDAVHNGPVTLDLSSAETWIVAGGTTLGVVVFCTLPVLAVWRGGFRLRPRFDFRHPALGTLLRGGAWAGVFLALTQVTQLVIVQVANRDAGALTTYQFAFILFTLPHALFSVPVMTTRFPGLSRSAQEHDWESYRQTTALAIRAIGFMALLSTAVSISVARPAAVLLADESLALRIADATMAFAPGIVGFGLMLFFTRAMYATGDARTPTLVNLCVVVCTAAVMLVLVPRLDNRDLVTGLGAAFAGGQLLGAVIMGGLVHQRLVRSGVGGLQLGPLLRSLLCALVASLAGLLGAQAVGWTSRSQALVALAVSGGVATAVYLGAQWASGGPSPRTAVLTFGGGK